jgi:hypothetical protein
VIPSSVEEIGKGCFSQCTSLCEVIFEAGSSLRRIESNAFKGINVRRIIIPSSVEEIGEYCFTGCGSLCEVIFETGSRLREIGDFAFDRTNVSEIEIPSKCETLSAYSLFGVKSVTISKENALLSVEEMMMCKKDKKLIRYFGSESRVLIKRDIEVVGKFCFHQCRSVREVTFEEGSKLQRIEARAFYQSGLTRIAIPSNIEEIGDDCFYPCEQLSEIVFEEGSKLRGIAAGAFRSCGLMRIAIPSSVKCIESEAFCDCESLREIVFEGIVPDVGVNSFLRCPVELIKIPHGMSLPNQDFLEERRIELIGPDSDP